MDLQTFGRWLVGVGILIVVVGGILMVSGKVPFIGRLPGDIYIKRENFSFYFPVVTCLVIGLLITLLFRLFGRR
jgi:hypothetical protein